MTALEEHRIEASGGVFLHVVMAGPKTGKPLVFLHGFPEFWFGWKAQIEHFAAQGYRVIVPDQRGYNLSDKPDGIANYQISHLAADIVAILDRLGIAKAFLVGHDWGGAVSWFLAGNYPTRIEKLAVLNMPHLAVFGRHLRENPVQRKKSRYVLFFQLPLLPEFLLSRGNHAALARTLQSSSRAGTFSDTDLRRYHEAWAQPGALRSMIHWYRATRKATAEKSSTPTKIPMPTILIWGTADRFLGAEMAQESIDLCADGKLTLIPGATHWVAHEEPARVNELLQDFFQPKKVL